MRILAKTFCAGSKGEVKFATHNQMGNYLQVTGADVAFKNPRGNPDM